MVKFKEILKQHFPDSLLLKDYMHIISQRLLQYGFNDKNTIACVSTCRDEMTRPLFDLAVKYWGERFNFSSLGGFLTLGKTGFSAASSHAPIENGIERYVFFTMPHIAISRNGEIGVVYRDGRKEPSHACGALEHVVHEVNSGNWDDSLDIDDLEQSTLKSKIILKLGKTTKTDLLKVTKLSHDIIREDLEKLVQSLDVKKVDYAVHTGIMIHGPFEKNYVYPQSSYVVKSKEKIELVIHDQPFLSGIISGSY